MPHGGKTITIEGLRAIVLDWRHVQVTGNVLNGDATYTVTLTGIVNPPAFACNADGSFSYTGVIATLGTVTAQSTDGQGVFSENATVTADCPACTFRSGYTCDETRLSGNSAIYNIHGTVNLTFPLPDDPSIPNVCYSVRASNMTFAGPCPFYGSLPYNGNFDEQLNWGIQLPLVPPNGNDNTIWLTYTDPFNRSITTGILFVS